MSVRPPRFARQHEPVVLGLLGLTLAGLAWEVAARFGWINPIVLGSPGQIGAALARQWAGGELLADVLTSVKSFMIALAIAALIGLTTGSLMGLSQILERTIEPFAWFLYSAPLVAFYPLLISLFGFGTLTVIVLAVVLAVIPVIMNTLAAFRTYDRSLALAVRGYGGRSREVVLKVILPGAIPLVFAGLKIASGRALIGVVVGEMFGTNAGLGFRLVFYGARLRSADLLVALLGIVAMGLIATTLLGLLEQRLSRWRTA